MLDDTQQNELSQARALKAGGSVHDSDFECFRNMTCEEPTIIDVGANRDQSIVSFQAIFPQAIVDSFEANPFFLPVLQDVGKWYEEVTIHTYGLGFTEDTLEFYVPVVDGRAYLEEGSTRRDSFEFDWVKERLASYGTTLEFDIFPVEIRTAPSVIGEKLIDIVKIDVEGAEMDVLSSMDDLIGHLHPVFLVEDSDFHKVTEFLSSRGYECFQYLADVNSLVPLTNACTSSSYIHPGHSRGLHSIVRGHTWKTERGRSRSRSQQYTILNGVKPYLGVAQCRR